MHACVRTVMTENVKFHTFGKNVQSNNFIILNFIRLQQEEKTERKTLKKKKHFKLKFSIDGIQRKISHPNQLFQSHSTHSAVSTAQ